MVMEGFKVSWETACEAFLWSRRVMGVSEATLKWHSLSLRLFLQCHHELNLSCNPADCPPEHLRMFLHWLSERGVKLTTQNTYYRSLRAFFRFLISEGVRDDTPTKKVPAPRTDQPLPKTVTEEHFLKTISTFLPDGAKSLKPLKSVRLPYHKLRNLTLFVMAFDTGARLSELVSLKIGQIDITRRVATVKGKGRKERMIVFGSVTAGLIAKLLIARRLTIGEFTDDDYLFAFKNGSPLNKSYVGKEWRKAQRKAGLNPLPFHGLRHGFARLWLLRGGDAISLQIILGHTSSDMTKRYVTLWGRDLAKLHAQVSPIDKVL
ncbi:MAG: tyrosine-type recombinase/integrase [Archaeoglobaceae archaeon]